MVDEKRELRSSLDQYMFPMKQSSWLLLKREVSVYTHPDFQERFLTGTKIKKLEKTYYVAKVKGTNNEYFWAKLTDGNFIPLYRPKDLKKVRKLPRPGRYERVGNVIDQNTEQPFENIWPYSAITRGLKFNENGKKTGFFLANVTTWERQDPLKVEDMSKPFVPTDEQKLALDILDKQVRDGMVDGDIVITYLTDSHIDSYQTPGTAAVVNSMRLMSYYAKNYGADLVVHGGDLNDGVKPKEISEQDVEVGVQAIKESGKPFIILQGNHDDNSGYTRDNAGYLLDQLITNEEAWQLRQSEYLNLHENANHAVYGTYEVPDSDIMVVVLDGFDQPDVVKDEDGQVHFGSFRHGYTHYSEEQINWLRDEVLGKRAAGKQLLFINHIAPNGVDNWVNTIDMAGKHRSQRSYLKTLFENNTSTNKAGINESNQIFKLISEFERETGNVIGYIAGHTHTDNFAYKNGIWFVTQTSAIADRGDGAERFRNQQHTRRSLAGINSNAWTVLRISPKNRTVNQYRLGWKNDAAFLNDWRY
ncbi:metallophosphoesterase [Lentilactobacillus sp. Marseille-Q4993]|uniref:metallophosphoesterase family protein n=1 Tax=Lentilactobacillus sp. Marseille-Q4993 TaxID=3039492 RepID=UPI0024BC696F|nr:metallophosphoesterase [Lentilactobacillus sp. Marseille-Q4993]